MLQFWLINNYSPFIYCAKNIEANVFKNAGNTICYSVIFTKEQHDIYQEIH